MKPQTAIQKGKALFALKQKVVISLNKLSDRDTYQLGSTELERMAQSLSIDTIPPFLSCITDMDSESKSLVRKECIRLMGVLVISHRSLLTPQMPKIISSIVKRLKDSDSIVRDACVDTCGVLAKNVGNFEGIFIILVRPLFEALGEQNRYIQTGGALCLSKVIDEIGDVPNSVLPQILVRVVKLLKNPHFMAKPAVIELIGSIVQRGISTENTLSSALTSILETLKDRDWNTRKASAIALSNIAMSCGYILGSFKNLCLRALEASRFDKVKPVRDSVIHAIQCWKSVPGVDPLEISETGSSTKENFYNDYSEVASTSENGSRPSFRKLISNSVSNSSSFLNPIGNKNIVSNSIKRAPLSLKKLKNPIIPNPNSTADWQIEVSVPKKNIDLPLNIPEIQKEIKEEEMEMDMEIEEEFSEIGSRSGVTKDITMEEEFDSTNLNLNLNLNNDEADTEVNSNLNLNSNLSGSNGCCVHMKNELVLIRKQLEEIESKNSNLYQLLQEFIGNSTDNLATLNSKVYNMENTLDRFVDFMTPKQHKFGNFDSKNSKKGNISISSSSSPIDINYQSILPSKNSKIFANEKSTTIPLSPQINPERSTFSNGGSSSISSMSTQSNSKRCNLTNLPKRVNGFDWLTESPLSNNEGSSSVNSKRIKGFVSKTNDDSPLQNSFSNNDSKLKNMEKLSKRVNGYLNIGDIESAYAMVIDEGDDSSVIGLMDVTGPVLDDLSSETASEVLRVISMHVMDKKFLELSLPWIQQVVGLSGAQDSRQLFLSPRAKRELLCALHEVTNKGNLNPTMRLTVSQLASRLGKAFGLVQSRKLPPSGA